MARPLLIPHRENVTIEEHKQVSRLGTNQTVTRYSARQMLLAIADRQGTVDDQSCIAKVD